MEMLKSLKEEAVYKFKAKSFEHLVLETHRSRPFDFDSFVTDIMTAGKDSEENDEDRLAIWFGSHKGHPAGFPVLQEAAYVQDLTNPLLPPHRQSTGIQLLVASNIAEGQNPTVTTFHRISQDILPRFHTQELGILRDKDTINMDVNEIYEIKRRQRSNINTAINMRQVFVSFPEGTVQSGVQKEGGEPGEINGIVKLPEGSVQLLCTMMRRKGIEPVLFFVGNTGENHIYDPTTKHITHEAYIKGGAMTLSSGKLGKSMMSSIVDYPTTLKQIEQVYGVNGILRKGFLEQYCGERLAQLVPHHERGYYANTPILDNEMQLFEDRGTPIYDRRLEIKRRLLLFPPRI